MIIDSQSDFEKFCNDIYTDISTSADEDRFLALDTEFIREKRNTPLLCLLQVASQNHCAAIDTLAIKDLSFIKNIMKDESVLKVFHSCDQDLDILSRYGVTITKIYDTQIAELALSYSSICNYEALVKKYTGHSISKSLKVSDWKVRPLSNEQVKYALDDVIYLRQVYKQQSLLLKDMNRELWISEEIARINSSFSLEETLLSAFEKVIWQLNETAKDNLKTFLNWRHIKALESNIPDFMVIKNDVLLSVAKCGMMRIRQEQNSRFNRNKYYKEFFSYAEQICSGQDIGNVDQIENTTRDKYIVNFLSLLLDVCARSANVHKSLIASKDDISSFVMFNNQSVGFTKGWRYDVYGLYAQKALFGEISLKVLDNNLVIDNE